MSLPPPLPGEFAPGERRVIDVWLAVVCMSAAIGLTIVFCVVVPRVEDSYKDFGTKLPGMTILMLRFSHLCAYRYWDKDGGEHINYIGMVLLWVVAALPAFLVPLLAPWSSANAERRYLRMSRVITTVVLALLIGWVVVSLFMPMVTLVQSVSSGGKKGG